MSLQWYPYYSSNAPTPPEKLVDWLLDPGSFMQRLQRSGIIAPRVQVLSQAWHFPDVEERSLLGIAERRYALVREVLIASREGKWMFARSVFPQATLTGREQLLARLKNRALGTFLFKRSGGAMRSPFEICKIKSNSEWFKKINQYVALNFSTLWARRSLLQLKNKSLLLTEFFFPNITELSI